MPKSITGKFAEHLGANIYNGMDAQILRNPTLADYPFWNGQMSPDGITQFQSDEAKIVQDLRRQAIRSGWPETELSKLVEARADGLACFWEREGERAAVQVSPDTGPHGARAQRLEVHAAGQGLAQWAWLPLHRVRRYQFEIFARSPNLTSLTVSLWTSATNQPVSQARVTGLSGQWQTLRGDLEIGASWPADVAYRLSLTADAPGQFIVGRVLLRPSDHINGADPDIVRLLRESRLPLLRWPGGNFASGYHWEDGVGPIEQRPTLPNYAWGNVEPNLFGTDEFIAFCRAVGCEPMICVNAGSGTPNEAARWIQYCNAPADSLMGARRAANGHPAPYQVRYWEVGNELWGRWQYHWTTALGYVDRYLQFTPAMLAADGSVQLYACGAPVLWGKQWNDTLFSGAASSLRATTDHPLIGGSVSSTVEPLDVYRDFMLVPEVLEQRWRALEQDMTKAGIKQPRLAVTELQMFAHLRQQAEANRPVRLTNLKLVNPATLGEALYDVLIYHAAVRLAPFVEMVTHSAVVNHGGGLRKERERVYANPCYYAQSAFAAFAGATPVTIDLESPVERSPGILPDLKNVAPLPSYGAIDALAALMPEGRLLLSIVHRGTAGPVHLRIELDHFVPAGVAEVRTLTADAPWASNSYDAPEAVKPAESTARIEAGKLEIEVPPFTVMRVTIPPQENAEATNRQTYQVTGVIREIKPDRMTAVIAHEAIPGYMEAMIMPLPVKDPQELATLKAGDRVTFRMIVTGTEGWIDRVTKVDSAVKPVAPVEPTFHIARNVEPLNLGDTVPEYHFTNELGKAVSLSQFRDQAVALTFFFTRCPFPNFCPRLSSNFEEAQQKLKAMPQGPTNWHLLSISFDTQRDTPNVLHYYARKYQYNPQRWSFVTGDLVEIEALADQVGEMFWREGDSMSHNQRTVVLDTRGRLQRIFIGNEWKVDDLVAEMIKAAAVPPAAPPKKS